MPKKQKRRYIDFAKIRVQVTWEQAINFLDLAVEKEGATYRACCPIHPDARERALAITPEEGFTCYQSDQSGHDVISLVAHVLHCGQYDAAAKLEGNAPTRTAPSPPEPVMERRAASATVPSTVPQTKKAGANPPNLDPRARLERISGYLHYDHEALAELGEEEARELTIGYAKTGTMAGMIVIPVRLPDGSPARCIGVPPILFDKLKIGGRFDATPSNVVPLKKRA